MNRTHDVDGMPAREPHNCPDCAPGHTPTPFSTQELVSAALDQVSYAIRYQNGENINELQKACFRISEVEPIIVRAVNAHEELLEMLYEVAEDIKCSDSLRKVDCIHCRVRKAIAKAEGK